MVLYFHRANVIGIYSGVMTDFPLEEDDLPLYVSWDSTHLRLMNWCSTLLVENASIFQSNGAMKVILCSTSLGSAVLTPVNLLKWRIQYRTFNKELRQLMVNSWRKSTTILSPESPIQYMKRAAKSSVLGEITGISCKEDCM